MQKQKDLIKGLLEQESFILIVLDACRYDYFHRINNVSGALNKVQSSESSTGEWLLETWPDFYDVACVSANPLIASKYCNPVGWTAGDHFEYVEDVWNWGWHNMEGIETVPAGEVVEGVAKVMARGYTRIIAHFMQPHPPYIGTPKLGINTFMRCRNAALGKEEGLDLLVNPVGFQQLVTLVKLAYAGNLRYVLDEGVKPLLKYKGYRIVVTADHGEILGERDDFGHGGGKKVPELLEVPWFVPKKGVGVEKKK